MPIAAVLEKSGILSAYVHGPEEFYSLFTKTSTFIHNIAHTTKSLKMSLIYLFKGA